MRLQTTALIILSLAILFNQAIQKSFADVISPSIKDRGKKYSTEKARSDYYGTGPVGRMTEASELRFAIEGLLEEGDYEAAIPKAKKAVQLDPGYPEGHILLARALTAKFYQQKGSVDEKLLAECLREWQLIRYHDADVSEQFEAGDQAKRLIKIAKVLERDRQIKLEKEAEKKKQEMIIAKKNKSGTDNSKTVDQVDSIEEDTAETSVTGKLASKKKHFVIF